MEVETRPPLVDGQLGLHALRGSPDLGLSITENDIILSDDERELVQSPVEERISYVKDSFVSGSERGDERDDVPGESSSSPKCNGDVPTEPVSDAASVFRTESSSEEVRGAELDGGTSKDCSEGDKDTTSAELSLTEEESCPESFSLSVGPCDVTSSEGVVEDSLHNSESHVSGNQTPVDGNSQDDQLKTVSRTTESSGDVKHPNRNGEKDVEDLSGLPPKSFKDFDDLDEIEIPEVIDISSISFNKGNHDESIPVEDAEFSNQVEDETAASSDVAVNEKEDDDATAEAYGDKAGDVDPMVDECMGFDQEEDESPGYHGMTDDILPIIESELDDIPVGEGNIFDTEVECGDSTSMEEPENQDETIADLSADIDIADNEPSHLVSENSRTADDGSEESLVKKDLRETFSSSAHPKLKRRASADEVTSPPCKLLKRQTSLDHLYECAEKPVRAASIEEFRKLASKNSSPAPKSIASEPVDTPVEIEKNEVAAKPAERKDAVADSLETPTESAVKEPSGDGKESVLVIDLDDDDKMNTDPSAESHSDGKVESSKSAHRSALDVLFNGKKEITLNRKMFTRVMKSCVSQYLLTFSDLGKATSFSLKANTVLSRIQSNVSSFEKQKDDFKSIMTKLIKDRQAKKTWDETLVPPKVTRSVGLQVCSVGSMYVKNAPNSEGTSTKISRSKFSSSHQNQALIQQKKAYAQQQLALSQSKVKQVELQMASMRPIAKKSVTPTNRPVAIKTIPATKPMVPPKPKPVPQFPVTSPKMNGLKAVSMTRNPEPAGTQNNTPLTITTASPNARTFTLSNRGTYAVKSPQKTLIQVSPVSKPASTLLSKALTASDVAGRGNLINVGAKPGPQSVSKAVPVALTRTPGPVHNSKNLTSGPGRPGKSPVPLKKPLSSLETTIDLTDLDDDAPQPAKPVTSNTTARKSTSSASRAALQSKVPNIAPNKQMRHPPLPPNPPNFSSQFAPPRPYLGICDTQTVTQGIMLTWHFNNVTPPRKISKFQVFAYQETKGDGEDAWKKVGDVDALPLPMACTLTQFREGYTYHFIVRAVDEAANVGPFSAPNTITLMKKTV